MAEPASLSELAGAIANPASPQVPDTDLRSRIEELILGLSREFTHDEAETLLEPALRACERLHGQARSSFALPLVRAIREAADRSGNARMRRWSATACGVLLNDTGDTVGAIEQYIHALRLAVRDEDRRRMSGLWHNIGSAFSSVGSDEMGMRCEQRALALLEKDGEPVYQRYLALATLAHCCYKLARMEEGVGYGERAMHELTDAIRAADGFNGVSAHRDLVRMYVELGRLDEARAHVEAADRHARGKSMRVQMAAGLAKAAYESATGQHDIALTRVDGALSMARSANTAFTDALVCAVRTEEAAGHPARALLRLEELSQHVYRANVEAARVHIRDAGLALPYSDASEHELALQRSRLVSQLDAPRLPDGWKALRRLAAKATMPADGDGRHGDRVGALARLLAEAIGIEPVRARELGHAAELHDIGMSAVPPEILAKRGALNPSERRLVSRHAEAGAEIMAEGQHPRMLLAQEIARYHHARFDGQGYPAVVAGTAIPLGARLCAVVDAYDMMVCGCGGGPRRSMGEALEELRRNAGGQFDPELVDRFDDVIRSEAGGLGMDLSSGNGMEDFNELVLALKEDRGFV